MYKSVICTVLCLMTFYANADIVRLDFSVDINQRFDGLSNQIDPNITIGYSMLFDTYSPSASTGFTSDGREVANTVFAPTIHPTSIFTNEVLAEINQPLNTSSASTSIYREYSASGYGSGLPETFQALHLHLDAHSDVPSGPGTYTSYQRGLDRQGVLGAGNMVTTFDGGSFVSYMETLIGNSDFYFNDSFIISEIYADGSGNTIDQFGYAGIATLTGVSIVPAPAAVWLFGSGLLGLFGLAKRKIK